LGGWLTIANCAVWPLLFFATKTGIHSGVIIISMLVFSAPVACFWIMPQVDYGPTTTDIIGACILIGFNSFIWGYGLAAILKWLFRSLTTSKQMTAST
jgi:hypothetical protein